jgi:hypothetical protein
MRELARKSATNYLPLLVKTFAQVMKADGYYSDPTRAPTTRGPGGSATGWTPVRRAVPFGAPVRRRLRDRAARHLRARTPGPAISLYSPREMTAVYQDPEADEWPMLALGVDGRHVTLFDEEMVYEFGIERTLTAVSGPGRRPRPSTSARPPLTFIDAKAHDLGVCPVVRFRDRNLLAGEEQYGIVEPLMTIRSASRDDVPEPGRERLLPGVQAALRPRLDPEDEQEELKAGAARIWYLDEDPKTSDRPADAAGIDRGANAAAVAAIRDFAAIGQIPAQALGIDGISNISDATLAGLEAAKNREAGEITTSLGESHEQLLRLCAYIDGNDCRRRLQLRAPLARLRGPVVRADGRRARQAGHRARSRPGDRARGRARHDRAASGAPRQRPWRPSGTTTAGGAGDPRSLPGRHCETLVEALRCGPSSPATEPPHVSPQRGRHVKRGPGARGHGGLQRRIALVTTPRRPWHEGPDAQGPRNARGWQRVRGRHDLRVLRHAPRPRRGLHR